MGLVARLWRRWRETPEQRSLRRIREHFAAVGYDLSEISDDDLRAGVRHLSEVVAQHGLTLAQASEGLQQAMATLPKLRDYTEGA